jgi:predicted nucleic acid-binding protein
VADYLLDCNHLSRALRKVSPVRERIHQARRAGHRFISCYPILCELEAGIQQTPKSEENRRRLGQFGNLLSLLPRMGPCPKSRRGRRVNIRGIRGRRAEGVCLCLRETTFHKGHICKDLRKGKSSHAGTFSKGRKNTGTARTFLFTCWSPCVC